MTNFLKNLGITVRFVVTACLFFFIQMSFAQEMVVEDRYEELFGTKPVVMLSFRNTFSHEDYMLGGEVGMMDKTRKISVFATFDIRPFRKKVWEYTGNNLFYQYREDRYMLGIGGEYLGYFHGYNFGPFAQANVLYTWGRYGGTEHKPEKGWVLVPRFGVFWRILPQVFFKVGYAYQDTKTVDMQRHHIHLAISGIISKQ